MRIRRNPWLPCVVAAAVVVSATVHAQSTTGTVDVAPAAPAGNVSTGTATASTAPFGLEVGDQLQFRTRGSVGMTASEAGQSQTERIEMQTSVTVLQKQAEVLTMYSAMTIYEETTTGTQPNPGPRFTFEMPVTGAEDGMNFEVAGLAGTPFPTFSMETLFAAASPEGKTSVTVALPFTNQPVEGSAVTTAEGPNSKTVVTLYQNDQPVMARTRVVSGTNNVTSNLSTSATLALSGRGAEITIALQDETELTGSDKLSDEAIATLRQDIETALPISESLQSLNPSSSEAMKTALDGMNSYLERFPNGEFAFLFNSLTDQLASVVARTDNWDKIKEGAEAPEFEATTIDGKAIKLSDYRGKVVLIDFWATWCGPCIVELPNVKTLYDANKDKGFEIIGISADEDISDLQQLVEQEDLQWPQVFDGGDDGGKVQEIYGVMKYPTMILVDKEGKINAVDVRGEQLEQAVTALLGEE